MQCPNCQAPLVPGAVFCVQCGQPVAQTPATPDAAAGGQMSAPFMPATSSMSSMSSVPRMPPDSNNPLVAPTATSPTPLDPTIPASFGAVSPAPAQPQPFFSAQPLQPSQPFSQPFSQPLAQPGYGALPPSQPLYAAPFSQQGYGAPASVSQTLLGPNGIPGASQPYSRVQALLMRNLSPSAVFTPWITAIIGAAVALVAGLILTFLAGVLWSNALSDALGSSLPGTSGSGYLQLVQKVLTPDLLKLFALANHVSLTLSGRSDVGSASGSGTLSLAVPLTGLLLAPALALTLGGYVAASSDFTRLARYSIARGALIAPFYAVLLAICAVLGSSTVANSAILTSFLPSSGPVTIAPSLLEAVLYGLLWGAIFGALGGWIHVSGRFWLSTALATLRTIRSGRIAGALAGAVAALATAILLFSAAYIGLASFDGVSGVAFSTANSGPSTSIVTTLTLYLLFAPVVAVYGFALATGAPIGVFLSDSASHLNANVTISLLTGYQATGQQNPSGAPTSTAAVTPHFPPSPLFYLLILGALISYLVGGRVAARVARAAGAGQGFVAGALMAVPLSLFMTFAAYLAAAGYTVSGVAVSATQSDTFSFTISPVYGGMFLAVLIGGAVFGGLGGASLAAMPALGGLPRALLLPIRPAAKLLAPLLDALSGRDRRQQPGQATRWIYDGAGALLVFAILTGALVILNNAAPTLVPFTYLWWIEGLVVGLLVAVPLACFLGALLAAFTTPAPITPMAAPVPAPLPLAVPQPMPVYAAVPAAPATMPGATMPGTFAPSMPLPQGTYPPSFPLSPVPAVPQPTMPTPPPSDAGASEPGPAEPGAGAQPLP